MDPRSHLLGLALAALAAGSACAPDGRSKVDRALAERREQDAWTAACAAVAADSSSAAAWCDLSRAALRTFRTVQGVIASGRAMELAPDDWRARVLRAELDQARFRNVAAVRAAREATELAPDEPLAWRALGAMRLGGGMVGTADPPGSEAAYAEALRLGGEDDPRARLGLAVARMLDGRHEEARPDLDALIEAGNAPAEAYYQRGLARMRVREFEGAVEDFRETVRREPGTHAAWFNLGRLLPRLGFPDEAKDALARGRDARAGTEQIRWLASSWHENGEIGAGLQLTAAWRAAGRLDESLLLAETIIADSPRVPPAWLEYAETLLALGRTEEAAAAADRVRGINPANPRARVLRAQAAMAAGDPETALEALGPPSEAGPAALAVIGQAWSATGRPREGERALTAALGAGPRQVDWLIARAEVRGAIGANAPAIDDLRLATSLEPDRIEAWTRLAELLDVVGRAGPANEARARRDSLQVDATVRDRARGREWRTDLLVP